LNIEILPLEGRPVAALMIGSVVDTLAGRVDPRLCKQRFRATDYAFGFEAASPKELSSVGESVLVNGTCYATSTEEGSLDYGKVIWGSEFVTGGMFLLPKGVQPTHRLNLTAPMQFDQLCHRIYQGVQRPVAFVGIWESETLYTMAIGKPPIHGRPIFENREYYFPMPPQTLRGTHAFVMGVMTFYGDKQWQILNKNLEVVLYKNPFDREFSLSSHTHCLVLKSEVTQIDQVIPTVVERCLHVFTDKTTVKKAHLNLYALDRVDPLWQP